MVINMKKNSLEVYRYNPTIDFELNEVLDVNSLSTSPWWKSLEVFVDGIKNMKDFISKLQYYYKARTVTTIRVCPGIKDLMKDVIVVKMPYDVMFKVDWNSETEHLDYWVYVTDDRCKDTIVSHPPTQYTDIKNKSSLFADKLNVKFQLPITFKSHNLRILTLDSFYHNENPFKVMPGVIKMKKNEFETSRLNINTFFPLKSGEYYIKAGTPICYLYFPDGVKIINKLDVNKQITKTPLKRNLIGNRS